MKVDFELKTLGRDGTIFEKCDKKSLFVPFVFEEQIAFLTLYLFTLSQAPGILIEKSLC